MIENLTVDQLQNACDNNQYLILRYRDGETMAINTKVSKLIRKRNPYLQSHRHTRFISYKPCGFMDYISHKDPFISF